ncbi:TIGR04222 domain-containing membrane protein [Lentzea xinjiangensis]|uniref:TIGR04222 domain-containing membrane protein n=1 Tax=Lentzea xinjiangensis TaxID=402600 RepID=UPI000B7E060A
MRTPEELGCLSGGPSRAAGVALARLLQAGLVRVSREGVVTAVHRPPRTPISPLEARILGEPAEPDGRGGGARAAREGRRAPGRRVAGDVGGRCRDAAWA